MSRVERINEGIYSMIAYTDGAFSNSRNRGGYSFVLFEDGKFTRRYFRGIDNTTNQRTEMLAVISFFRYLINHPFNKALVITDSMYVVGTTCNNWKMKANVDLWGIYFKLYEQIKDRVDFMHVRGHQGIEGNELADIYAVIASEGKDYNGQKEKRNN